MASRMIQNNFGGGEISPVLYGRSDLSYYYKGCARAKNFIVSKEGTLRKRHGISSIIELGYDYSNCTILPYRFDRTEGGFLLLNGNSDGDIDVIFYDKTGFEKSTAVIEGVIAAEGKSISEQIKSIQSKQIGDQVWITNGSFFRYITVTDNETITVNEWRQAVIPSSIAHNDSVNHVSTHWSINRDANRTGKTINYGIIGVKDSVNSEVSKGSCTWASTWVAGTYINIHVTIAVSDKTKWDYIIFGKRSGGTYGELTRVYMEDKPDAYLYTKGNSLAEAFLWSDGKYYDKDEGSTEQKEVQVTHHRYSFKDENHSPGDAVYGQTNVLGEGFTNPLCIDCFQQRRVFANATIEGVNYPMTMWFSEVGNINNFYADRPTDDDDAFSPTISSTGPSFIRWIVCYQENMILLTDCGMFSVGFAQTQGFSASTCRISRFSQIYVSPTIQPVVTDAGIVFVGGDNKTLYTASFDLQENTLKPINRSVLVEHLTRSTQIKAIALQEFPNNVIWVATDDGKMCTFTFERNEEVYAWSSGEVKDAQVLDIISLGTVTDAPSGADYRTYGDLIFVVKDGDKEYVAALNHEYIDHIGGKYRNINAELTTLRPESQERTIVGYKKNIKDILVKLYRSGQIRIKPANGGTALPLVEAKSIKDGSLFTGDVKIMPRGFINEEGQLILESDGNQPCEILQIVTTLEVAQ